MSGHFIPESLTRTRTETHGAEGRAWLDRLPAIVAHCVQQWALALEPPYPGLSYNYAAPGTQAGGAAIVLKVCYPDREFYTEAEALRTFAGRGALRLLATDLEHGALLLEQLRPGASLHTVPDIARAAQIAAGVMRRLWRPAPPGHPFPTVDDWVQKMARQAPQLIGAHGPFPYRWIERALALYASLTASPAEAVLLHGDLHHDNIRSAGREPWLAIDPKGVIGEPVWETGPLLLNAVPDGADLETARPILHAWVERLAAELGLAPAHIAAWGLVRWVLASYWTVEDHGSVCQADMIGSQVLEEML